MTPDNPIIDSNHYVPGDQIPIVCTCDRGVDHCIVHGSGIGQCVVCGQPGEEGEIHGDLPHSVRNRRADPLPPLDHVPGCDGSPHPPSSICSECPPEHRPLDHEQMATLTSRHIAANGPDHDDPPRYHSGGYIPRIDRQNEPVPDHRIGYARNQAILIARAVLADERVRELIKGLIDEIDGRS